MSSSSFNYLQSTFNYLSWTFDFLHFDFLRHSIFSVLHSIFSVNQFPFSTFNCPVLLSIFMTAQIPQPPPHMVWTRNQHSFGNISIELWNVPPSSEVAAITPADATAMIQGNNHSMIQQWMEYWMSGTVRYFWDCSVVSNTAVCCNRGFNFQSQFFS